MKHNKDQWLANGKKVVSELQATPTSGLPWAIATVRTVRDGIIADIKANDKLKKQFTSELEEAVKASCLELIHDLGKANGEGKLAGFACNASAAAKAAELETSAAANLASKLTS